MTLEKPPGAPVKLGTYELLKEQTGLGVGSAWIARAAGQEGEHARLFSVVRVPKLLAKKADAVEAFLAEARSATEFSHPNAVDIVEVDAAGGEPFVVSELCEGELLSTLIASAGPLGLPAPVVLRIGLDVLAALVAAHALSPPLSHGELGPQHVLVGADGAARVLGFGSARALSRLSPPIGSKNHDRLAYAAPERVKAMSTAAAPAPPLDARADVFSVAVMIWEGVARQRLFASKIEAAIVQKVLSAPIPSLAGLPGVKATPGVEEALSKALDRDPQKRTQTAQDLAAAIEALGADKIASAKDVAAQVDKLAGKAIATRKAEIRAELARPVRVAGAETPPNPPVHGGAKPAVTVGGADAPAGADAASPAAEALPAAREQKRTLLGIVSPVVPKAVEPQAPEAKVPAAATIPMASAEAKARTPAPLEVKQIKGISARLASDVKAASAPKPAEKPAGEAEPAAATPAPAAIPAPAGSLLTNKRSSTLMMGSALAKPPEAPPAEAAPPPSAASAKLASASALLEATGSSRGSGLTPPSEPSSRGRLGVAVDKVGPGSTLGRYEILMPVARGGMASVWAAKLPGSRGFQKIFAVKTMLPDVSDDPDFESMFLDEGRVAARIRHPNVVEIIDLGEQDDVLYLVMEWVEGENLGALVKASRALGGVPMPVVLKIASQIASGLHAAHELRDDDGNLVDLVHRDVSPANVLVSTAGYVKIVDFGIAKSKGRLHVTRVGGVVKGKTPYLSPEQLGQLPIDRRSDLFSFGVLLYVLSTGLHPFRGETDNKTIENIALREPVPLRTIVPSVPAELEAIVLKALAKDPKDRWATAADMQRAVDQAATSLGITTSEEDVAAFVRSALGESLAKRGQDLKAAIDRAEGGRISTLPEPPSSEASPRPAAAPEPLPGLGTPGAAAVKDDVEVPVDVEPSRALPLPVHVEPKLPDAKVVVAAAVAVPVVAAPKPPPPPVAAAAPAPPPPAIAAARPAARSESDDAPLEVPGVSKRRGPVLQLAVGGLLGVCAILIAVVLIAGGKKGSPPAPAATHSVASTPPPPPPAATPAAAPAPPPSSPPSPEASSSAAPDTSAEPASGTAQAPAPGGRYAPRPGGVPSHPVKPSNSKPPKSFTPKDL
jgi:eukaryotic-like serine/threonine-protein kinase